MEDKKGLKSRLIRGISANAYGQAVTVLIQLVSVPLFIHYWGINHYGEWLILSALPAYLSMSDFGLGSVAGNSMVIKTAQNDKAGALAIYQSVSAFNAMMSLLILAVSILLLLSVDINHWLGIQHLPVSQVRLATLLMTLQILVGLQNSVLGAGYRSEGRYAEGTALSNTSRLIEWGLGMVMLVFGGGIVAVAGSGLAGRVLGYAITYIRLLKLNQDFSFSIFQGDRKIIKEMLKPGLAFLAFPLGNALSIQGMTLLIGSMLGSAAVAQFSVVRTVSRVLVQIVTVFNQATWPEISRAYGAGDLSLARKLHVNGCRFAILVGTVCVAGFLCIGSWVFQVWLGKTFSLPFTTFSLLLMVALINITSQASWVVLMATNHHQGFAIFFILSSCIAIALSYLTMPYWGINAAAMAVLLAELFTLAAATVKANNVLKGTLNNFIFNIASIKRQDNGVKC